LKRSNRLVLLVGVFLAIVAFIGVILLMQGNPPTDGGNGAPPTEVNVIVAKNDVALGTRVEASDVESQVKAIDTAAPGYFSDVSQVIGKVAREPITAGQQIVASNFESTGQITDITCPALRVCIAVQVDQVSGVGTLIKTGDYVDMVVGFTGDKFPVITLNSTDDTFTVVSGINSTSVKALLQGMQVMGTLLPPPPAEDPNAPDDGTGGETSLTGQQQIVILSVDTQQAEVIKFAQLDGSISLVLRSPDDFIDPATGEPLPVVTPVTTTGIILKTLVDTYGVLPPELVETVLPAQEEPNP
jgi:Flp pilus assembly protein CpaB